MHLAIFKKWLSVYPVCWYRNNDASRGLFKVMSLLFFFLPWNKIRKSQMPACLPQCTPLFNLLVELFSIKVKLAEVIEISTVPSDSCSSPPTYLLTSLLKSKRYIEKHRSVLHDYYLWLGLMSGHWCHWSARLCLDPDCSPWRSWWPWLVLDSLKLLTSWEGWIILTKSLYVHNGVEPWSQILYCLP